VGAHVGAGCECLPEVCPESIPVLRVRLSGCRFPRPQVDLWSLGVILFELHVGQPPFYTNSIYRQAPCRGVKRVWKAVTGQSEASPGAVVRKEGRLCIGVLGHHGRPIPCGHMLMRACGHIAKQREMGARCGRSRAVAGRGTTEVGTGALWRCGESVGTVRRRSAGAGVVAATAHASHEPLSTRL
jgi:hypothetical protein